MRFHKPSRLTGLCCAASLVLGVASTSRGDTITSASDAAFAGGTVVDFEGQPLGDFTSRTFGNMTLSTSTGHTLTISNTYSGQYASTGLYLDNNQGFTPTIYVDFANAVTAFGLNWGAADALPQSTLTVYADAARTQVIESVNLPQYPADGFRGIKLSSSATAGIKAATINITAYSSGGYDYILADDFKSGVVFASAASDAATPLPSVATAGMALMGVLGGKGLLGRRRNPVVA